MQIQAGLDTQYVTNKPSMTKALKKKIESKFIKEKQDTGGNTFSEENDKRDCITAHCQKAYKRIYKDREKLKDFL